MARYVEILFNLPLKQRFTYRNPVPDENLTGRRVEAPFGNRRITGWAAADRDDPPPGVENLREAGRVIDREPLFGDRELDLARWTADLYFCSEGEALAAMLPSGRREKLSPGDSAPLVLSDPPVLTEEQNRAATSVIGDANGLFYLYGVTGSGKTEVYLSAARHFINQGRGVIYLVPEITLTHELITLVDSRFSGRFAVLHSRLTPSRRLAEWRKILSGEALFVLGARSAVFAPVCDLGLLIIDEEHETSYKSGATPRYHARQVAMKRCRQEGATLVMGSATPSLEAWTLMEEGKLRKLELKNRVSGGSLPEITIVDMKNESSLFSGELVEAIHRVRQQGGQTVLFLNRRGFSYFFSCRSCQYILTCESCSVPMTWHKGRGVLVCHYCGRTAPPVTVCPQCASVDVGYMGFGTEGVESELARIFPDYRILRLDTDVAEESRERTGEILSAFRKGEGDILLGTQMVAKGLNFPKVRLAGIVMADTSLSLPDFRAEERTFSLITQVAGRAGRFGPGGRVIIQTLRPDTAAVRCAAAHDPEGFYSREQHFRRELRFPPYCRLFRLVFRSVDRDAARASAADFAGRLRKGEGGFDLMGPAECPIHRIHGKYRWQLLIRSLDFTRTHRALGKTLADFRPDRNVHIEVDIDPLALL